MIVEALKLYGTMDTPGSKNNPVIVAWAKEVGADVADVYKADSIPWCGCSWPSSPSAPARKSRSIRCGRCRGRPSARKSPAPALGDVLVFVRKGGGHVGLYVGEDASAFHVLGGNQSDHVCITRITKGRFYAARRPLYRLQPASVRPISLEATGARSLNEA